MVQKQDMISEWVLYWLDDQDEVKPTRDILDRLSEVNESRIRSKLQQLRNSGLVKADKKKEHGINFNATNYYDTTHLFESEYQSEYDLSIPAYVLRERLDEWQEFYDEYLDASQDRIRDLESQNKAQAKRIRQLEQENKKLKNRIEKIENLLVDRSESDIQGDSEHQKKYTNDV